ncbi:putative helicase/primase complex protein [Bienertia sinuspersici]
MFRPEKPEILGILAFDTAKSMSRLISLYKSLADEEMWRLRKEVIGGRGVSFLTSQDDGFLLTLACAERLEDLDRAVTAVSWLGQRCSDYALVRFGQVYKDLKNGRMDMQKLNSYGSKDTEKSIEKMDKFMSLTAQLYTELEELTQMEASERRMIEWRISHCDHHNTNYAFFEHKILNQRKLVRHLKEISLWNQSYDKIVGIMAKVVCVLYVRICTLYQPYISILPSNKTQNNNNRVIHQKLFSDPAPKITMSGPIEGQGPKRVPLVRFLNVKLKLGMRHHLNNTNLVNHNNKVFQAAPPSTVGGSGLAARYANVVLLAEKYLNTETLIGDQARQNLYNMLPSSLKAYVRSKLKVAWKQIEDQRCDDDELAEGWRKAVEDMLAWLVPVAQDTVTWQAERNMEKQRFDSKPTVLLLQTLHYADLEKTEAALAEVLVGLSCIYLYENRRISSFDIY